MLLTKEVEIDMGKAQPSYVSQMAWFPKTFLFWRCPPSLAACLGWGLCLPWCLSGADLLVPWQRLLIPCPSCFTKFRAARRHLWGHCWIWVRWVKTLECLTGSRTPCAKAKAPKRIGGIRSNPDIPGATFAVLQDAQRRKWRVFSLMLRTGFTPSQRDACGCRHLGICEQILALGAFCKGSWAVGAEGQVWTQTGVI